MGNSASRDEKLPIWVTKYVKIVRIRSRRDRYLGMTAAIPQVPVPTAI